MEEEDRSKIFDQIDRFEKKLKQNASSQSPKKNTYAQTTNQLRNNYNDDSSSDQEPSQIEKLRAMKDSLINKLYNKDKEIKELKQTIELISSKGEGDAKEKKIIQLAKKVRSMNLQLESYKTKAAQAMQHALDYKNQQAKASKSLAPKIQQNDQNQDANQQNKELSIDDIKRKLKDADKRIAKLRNQNVQLKTDYDKAYRALQKEVALQSGSKVNVDEIIRNPQSGWKGRAQQINLLKSKLKSSGMDLTTMSAFPQQSVLISQRKVEENLGKMGSNKAKIIEELSAELEKLRNQNKDLRLKYSGAQSRKNTLEGQIKGIKTDFSLKMKVLLQKTQTDDKLIKAMKEELQRSGGGTTKAKFLASSSAGAKSKMNQQQVSNILVQNANLRSQKQKIQTQLKKKTMEIQNFLQNKIIDFQQSKSKTKVRTDDKQKIMMLQNQISDLKQKHKHVPKTEQDLLIKDLTKQNINFRKKIDDLTIKLASHNEK